MSSSFSLITHELTRQERQAPKFAILSLMVRVFFVAVLLYSTSVVLQAGNIVDFENFNDGDVITNQIPGLTFTNTVVLSAGISLNEIDFPPHSGTNVAVDNGGPISIAIDPLLLGGSLIGFSGYFTYLEPLTIQALDSSNKVVASAVSQFSNNTGTGGDPGSFTNEFLQLSSSKPISLITLTGDPAGGSFAMDDLTFDIQTASITNTPEPATGRFLFVGLAVLCFCESLRSNRINS